MGTAAGARGAVVLLLGGLGLPVLSGCSNDLDALYCEPDCPQGGDGEPLPILPALPDAEAIPACEACVEQKCLDEQAQARCLADEICPAAARCWGTCDDPGCNEVCQETFEDAASESESDGLALLECAYFGACAGECQSGQNWGCADHYKWPGTDSLSLDVYVRFAPGQYGVGDGNASGWRIPLAGSTARACPSEGCSDRVERVSLDAAGGALLELPTNNINKNFSGFFELERDEPGTSGVHKRIHYWPLANELPRAIGFWSDWGANLAFGWVPDPDTASLFAIVLDCTSLVATGHVRFELVERPNAKVAHSGASGVGFEVPEGSEAFFPELSVSEPTEEVTVRAIVSDDVSGDRVIAERRVPIRAGWTSHVFLTPPSIDGQ